MTKWIAKWPQKNIFIAALVAAGLISLLDNYTGYSFRVTFLYIFPVLFVSWFTGVFRGVILSCVTAGTWFWLNFRFLPKNISHRVHYWNSLSLLLTLLMVSYVISNLKEKDKEAVFAKIDVLTGALNARWLRKELFKLVHRKQPQKPFSIIFFDLDNFKQVNDSLGHKEGDKVLQTVGKVIKNRIRQADIFARVGGDEFVMVFPDITDKIIKRKLSLIRKRLLSAMKMRKWPVTFSIGIVTFHMPPKTVSFAIKLADETMYEAKRAGKNRIVSKIV